ncbi:MAG: glycosyltransferase family 4 protein [Candidatus Saccharimonadales bacterium]
MKILLLSHSGLVTGGAEQCLLEYVDVLVKQGHKCKVIVPYKGDMTRVLTEKKVKFVVVGYGWATKPHRQVNQYKLTASTGNSLFRIFQEVDSYKPEVIITNTSVIPWGLYAGRTFRIPTILLVHEILNDKDPSLNMTPSYKDYAEILNKNTDYVIYNSQFVKNEFSSDIKLPKTSKKILYPLPKIDVVGINKLYIKNNIEGILKIAIFGVLAPRKNQIEAIKAAKNLVNQGVTQFTIDLYGDKDADIRYTKSLRRFIKENSLSNYIKIKGYSTNVYETMNQYNVVLSTSTYEPFGRTIVEGQLFGRIVIANNTGGGTELINDQTTGLVYKLGYPEDLAEKIKWILDNKSAALKLGTIAKTQQTSTFLNDHRYDALTDAIDYFAKKGTNAEVVAFDPMRALFEYSNQLNRRYRHVYKIFHNKITRFIKSIVVRVLHEAKKLIKRLFF